MKKPKILKKIDLSELKENCQEIIYFFDSNLSVRIKEENENRIFYLLGIKTIQTIFGKQSTKWITEKLNNKNNKNENRY